MVGVGVDILELARVRGIKDLKRAAEYVLTEGELQEFNKRKDKKAFFASRFAAKEAVIKAYPSPLSPLEFAITKAGRKPVVTFKKTQPYRAFISLSHSLEYVAGFAVVLEP